MAYTREEIEKELKRRQIETELKNRGLDVSRIGTAQTIPSEPIPSEVIQATNLAEFRKQQIAQGNLKPAPPSFGQRLVQTLPENIGGGVGGWAGARTGMKIASQYPAMTPLQKGATIVVGAGLGATLGGMGGKGWQQYYQMQGGKNMTLKDIYTDQLIVGLEQGATELAGRGIAAGGSKAINKFVAPAFKRLAEKGSVEAAEILSKYGGNLTLAQATKVRLFDTMEAIAEGSLIGGGKLQRIHLETQPRIIKEATEGFIDDFAKIAGQRFSKDEIGDITIKALQNSNEVFDDFSKAFYNALYKQADEVRLAKGLPKDFVDVKALKKFAFDQLADKLNINKSAMGTNLLETITKFDDNITLEQASHLRSALLTQERSMGANKDVAHGTAKKLINITHDIIDKATKELSPDINKQWNWARAYHASGKEIFNKEIIKKIGSKAILEDPKRVVSALFKPDSVKNIKLVKELVDDKTWNALKLGYIEDVVTKATNTKTGILNANTFMDIVGQGGKRSLGEKVLTETFTPKELNNIRKLAIGLSALERPTQQYAGTGRLAIAISQAGIIAGTSIAQRPKTSAAILLTPWQLARFVSNPRWNDLLLETVKGGTKSLSHSTNMLRIARIKLQMDLERYKQQNEQSQSYSRPLRGVSATRRM